MDSYARKYELGLSRIAGGGVFAAVDIVRDETIGLLHEILELHVRYVFTELGAMHNHSANPNCRNEQVGNRRYLVALRNICRGEELTTDYSLQPDLEQSGDWRREAARGGKWAAVQPDARDAGYEIVEGDAVDLCRVGRDVVLISETGLTRFCARGAEHVVLPGARRIACILLRDGERVQDGFVHRGDFAVWLQERLEEIDLHGDLARLVFG